MVRLTSSFVESAPVEPLLAAAKHQGEKPEIRVVAVEPLNSPVISQQLAGEAIKPGKHMIQGIGAGFIPDILNLDIIDEVMKVDDEIP